MYVVFSKVMMGEQNNQIEWVYWRLAEGEVCDVDNPWSVERAQAYLDAQWGQETRRVVDSTVNWVSPSPQYIL